MAKNIGFVHQDYPSGGAEKVTSNLAFYLSKKGYNVFVFAINIFEEKLTERDRENITFIKISKRNLYGLGSFFRNDFIEKAIENKIETLIFVGGKSIMRRKYIADKIGCQYIYAHHGMPFWKVEDRIQKFDKKIENVILVKNILKKIIYFYYRKIKLLRIVSSYKKIYDNCDSFIVLTNEYKQEFQDKLKLGDINKIEAISNGLLPPPIPYSFEKKKQLLYLGRMTYADKRIDRLIDLWKRISKDFSDWELLLVGNGSEREALEAKAKENGLERIIFCGETKTPSKYYNEASILCMTSQFEGIPLVLMEAQQAGVIPIAFNCSEGVQDLLSPTGKNGILVSPFDKDQYEEELRLLMKDSQKRKEMQSYILKKAKTYDLDVIVEKWISLFK